MSAAQVLIQVASDHQCRPRVFLAQRGPITTLQGHHSSELGPASCGIETVNSGITVPREDGPVDDDFPRVASIEPHSDRPSWVGSHDALNNRQRCPNRRPPSTRLRVPLLRMDRDVAAREVELSCVSVRIQTSAIWVTRCSRLARFFSSPRAYSTFHVPMRRSLTLAPRLALGWRGYCPQSDTRCRD